MHQTRKKKHANKLESKCDCHLKFFMQHSTNISCIIKTTLLQVKWKERFAEYYLNCHGSEHQKVRKVEAKRREEKSKLVSLQG